VAQEQFGPYRLEELIGVGGMGEVFRAYDTVRKRTVALKRLPTTLGADESFQARFRRESELAARLSEPHIIPIHDFGEIDGQLYIDMPLVSGVDLSELLERDGALPPERAVDIVAQVAMALDAAHARGLVHRDVKPSNVLIAQGSRGDQDFVYLVDFGVARTMGLADTALTATGSAVGTLDYMAPERFTGRADDARVDVYSLACVLYEALTGRKPFSGEGLPGMLYAHLNVDPPTPSRVRSAVPAALDEVVARGMAKDPDDRYPSAVRLAAAAREALAPRPTAPPTTIGAVPPPTGPALAGPAPSGYPQAPVVSSADAVGTGEHGLRRGGPLSDSRRSSRIMAATCMVLGPVLFTAGPLLLVGFPHPDQDANVFLDAAVADAPRYEVAALVTVLGMLVLVPGLIGVSHMLRGPRVSVGQLGAGLLIASAFVGNSYTFDVVVAVAAREKFDRDQVLELLGEAGTSPWLILVRLAALGGVLGLILLAVGLVLRRATPMWIPVLLAVAAVVRTLVGELGVDVSPRVLAVLDMALFAIPAIGIAIRILQFTDEQWARWIPLEDDRRSPDADAGQAAVPRTDATTGGDPAHP
jgi:hypothetical protein